MGVGLALRRPGPRRARPWSSSGFAGGAAPRREPRALQVRCSSSGAGAVHPRHRDARARPPRRPRPAPCRAPPSLFLVGAAAICGLPPLNGFVSEWLVYLGLLARRRPRRGGRRRLRGAGRARAGPGRRARRRPASPRSFGIVFLGQPALRARRARRTRRPRAMLAPDGRPGGGLRRSSASFPARLAAPRSHRAAAQWSGLPPGDAGRPGRRRRASSAWRVSLVAAALARRARCALVAPAAGALLRRRRAGAETWGCGYAAPTPRMQYTGSSFAEHRSSGASRWAFCPRVRVAAAAGPLPAQRRLRAATCRTPCSTAASSRPLSCARAARRAAPQPVPSGRVQLPRAAPASSALVALLLWRALRGGRRAPARARPDPASSLLLLPPLLLGVVNRTKALFAGPQGPAAPPALLRPREAPPARGRSTAATTTWVFRAGPVVGLAAVAVGRLLMPVRRRAGARLLRRRLRPLRLPARRWRASSPRSRRSTPARPSRAWARAREVTFAALAEPALFLVPASSWRGPPGRSRSRGMLRRRASPRPGPRPAPALLAGGDRRSSSWPSPRTPASRSTTRTPTSS